MKFIVGIGNPERQYAQTRHNVGFRALEGLAVKANTKTAWRLDKKCSAETLALENRLLVRPLTYVNLTGQSIRGLMQEHHAAVSDILIVCDDVNLAFGKIRLRDAGSAGGHHGLESVIEALGSDAFARLRVGVGNESMPKDDLTDFVLGRFNSEEQEQLGGILEKVSLVCESWVKDGFDGATNCLSRLQSIK